MSSCTVECVTANSGDTVTIRSGGTMRCTTVTSGGNEYVSSGGVATRSTITIGGEEIICGEGSLAELSVSPRQVLEDPQVIARLHDRLTCETLAEAANYINHYLTSPDPIIGRSGAVCPFVGGALRSDMITLFVLPSRTADPVILREAALTIKARFRPITEFVASSPENLRAAVIVMPYLDSMEAAHLVETVQKALKPEMIASGLMIGEFYPGCALPGLNNPAFRPAHTSFACLAIRRMTMGDLPFLIDDVGFVESYLDRFGKEGRRRVSMIRQAPLSDSAELDAARLAAAHTTGRCPVHAG
ncbi:MAG: DUF6875 domain-containing protein [Janthinobacterium lividum]